MITIALNFSTAMKCRIPIAFFMIFPSILEATLGQEDDQTPSVSMIQGLYQRQLYGLVDRFAEDQLRRDDLSEVEEVALVVEWMRSKTYEASTLTGGSRDQTWQSVDSIAQQFLSRKPNHRRSLLVKIQAALSKKSRGQLIGQEIAAEIQDAKLKAKALSILRQSTSDLKRLEKEVEEQIPQSLAQSDSNASHLSTQQLTNLKTNIRFQLAVVYLARAQLYDANERLNQINALNEVLQRLSEVISTSNDKVPIWWQAQIAKLKCYRIQKEWGAFEKLVDRFSKYELSPDFVDSVLTERVLATIHRSPKRVGNDLLNSFNQISHPSAELQLAMISLFTQVANSTASATKKQQLQTKAIKLVEQVEIDHGAYWGRRAEVNLIGGLGGGDGPDKNKVPSSNDTAILVRQGDSAFRKGNFSDAIKAYRKALAYFRSEKNGDHTLQLAARLAQSNEQLKNHSAAASLLFDVADEFPTAKLASGIHLRGCWNLGRVESVNQNDLIERLKKQIHDWPENEEREQANWWLGGIYQNQKSYSTAAAHYLAIDSNSPWFGRAVTPLKSCLAQLAVSEPVPNQSDQISTRDLVAKLRSKTGLVAATDSVDWNETNRELLIPMIELAIASNSDSPPKCVELLNSALLDTNVDSVWIHRANCLKASLNAILFLENRVSLDELKLSIKELPNDPSLMSILLTWIKRWIDDDGILSLNEALLVVCDKAMINADEKVILGWQIEKALLEVAAGLSSSSISELAVAHPKSLKIQIAYARFLNQNDDHDQALQQWRKLAAQVRPESNAWFEAKYEVVRLLMIKDKNDQARKLIRYLELTTQNWNTSDWYSKFERLRNELER